MWGNGRRQRLRKVKPGDGSGLKRFAMQQLFSRSLFFVELTDSDSAEHSVYAVDVRYFADEDEWKGDTGEESGSRARRKHPPAALYRDGIQVAASNLPATFAVPGGVIEVATSLYGLSRMHYVPDGGEPRTLQPHRRSQEGLRARFALRHPRASRVIGAVAVVVLLVGLVVGVPEGIEMLTNIDVVAERIGTFTSPIELPDWANTALLVAGILAAVERALTLRNHWLIDFDTTWTSL